MRKVAEFDAHTYWTVGLGASKYARKAAADLACELHLLGCTEVEVRLLKSEQVPCVGCSVTRSVFGVFTSAPDLAKSQRTFLDAREEDTAEAVLRRCRAWGLQEFYAKDWVPAYRLLCAASHPNDADLIKRAHDSYDETSQCAFPFEYFKATQAQMRAMYGPFYFGASGSWFLRRIMSLQWIGLALRSG